MRDAANEERRRTVVGVVSALELEARLDPRMRHVVDGMRQQLEREYGGQITALKRQVREQMADEERVRREAMREARREVGVAHAEQVQRSEHAKQSARFEQMTNTLHAGHVKAEKARAEKWEKTAEHEARLRQLETANGAADKGAAKLLVREQQLRTASIERERGLEAENAAVKKENRDLRTASTTAAAAHAAERADLETALLPPPPPSTPPASPSSPGCRRASHRLPRRSRRSAGRWSGSRPRSRLYARPTSRGPCILSTIAVTRAPTPPGRNRVGGPRSATTGRPPSLCAASGTCGRSPRRSSRAAS